MERGSIAMAKSTGVRTRGPNMARQLILSTPPSFLLQYQREPDQEMHEPSNTLTQPKITGAVMAVISWN